MPQQNEKNLKEKIKEVPAKPGVYLFRDGKNRIIYVGKAASLRNRVASYFQSRSTGSPKTDYMITKITDFEFIVTANETEALLLENNLIKKNQPRYNIDLKDDKTYPYIKLTSDKYPTAFITRTKKKDKAIYYGPYVNAGLARHTLRLMRKHLMIRSCTVPLKRIKRPCLMYHIHRCMGPCREGAVDSAKYMEIIEDVKLLLEGRNRQLLKILEERMEEASREQRYEQAASYRDFISHLNRIEGDRQLMVQGTFEEDILGFYIGPKKTIIQIFHIRKGLMVGRKELVTRSIEGISSEELMKSIITQYYFDEFNIPEAIVVTHEPEDSENITRILKEKAGRKVEIIVPLRGRRKKLLDLALENCKLSYETIHTVDKDHAALLDLKNKLRLDTLPNIIEGFDISTFQGKETVASMVYFKNGKPEKKSYRKYTVKTVKGVDDYASMREIVERRYKRLISENEPLPDLVLVDGGAGQLSAAREALEKVGLFDQPLISLAKKEELIYVHGLDTPLRLPGNSQARLLLQRIRDEAHRFAITFQRQKRKKSSFRSSLEDIPGIGPAMRKKLLRELGSIENIRKATLEELKPVIGKAKAEAVYNHFHASL